MGIVDKYRELKEMVTGTPEASDLQLQVLYQKVFGTLEGREVLTHMLSELCFFDRMIESEAEVALSNYARLLLFRIGVWREGNVRDLVDALLAMKIKPNTEGGQRK